MLGSVLAQNYTNVEVIIVDQNDDDRIVPYISQYAEQLNIKHIKQTARGGSRARNIGIKNASGDIFVFIDDDGSFPSGHFEKGLKYFEENPDKHLISGPVIDPETGYLYGREIIRDMPLCLSTVLRVNGNNIFLKADKFKDIHFAEDIGIGTPLGAGDESAYIFDLYAAGCKGDILKSFYTYHPSKEIIPDEATIKRVRLYSYGYGYVCRRAMKDFWTSPSYWIMVWNILARPFGATFGFLILGKTKRAKLHWTTFYQRLAGFFKL